MPRAHFITPATLGSGRPEDNPNFPGEYGLSILAEGDSWFSIGALPFSSNLLFPLDFNQSAAILNLAYPGEEIRQMSDLANNPDLVRVLATWNFNYRWDMLLLSGGGNDLIDQAHNLITGTPSGDGNDPESYIRQDAFSQFIGGIQQDYRTIVNLRDSENSQSKGVPVVAHTYDYPTPRNAPAAPGFGPWLYKVFAPLGLGENLEIAVTRKLIDKLADGLLALGGTLDNFHVVDTRGTLTAAAYGSTGDSNDWANEIHPNYGGYEKIAAKISAGITQLLS